ncbi:MAG: hypothetical protein A2504_00270 [Bdellovibrionales bacterium RIFOXYD12_FULL_39_22]|nr:MAG: hypothetical protein A2385_13880 [Bdellovibrionales bacterium RIFOXYB1_FULL_39_21]OFZ44295.1 MAG: hypothetical protein A2485_03115 [Bdellovibrionales bacterium RIFOXYC12_FULL_39_17]OFZ47051.1 MAG: hypothetical protein A2404_08040 [Bdellovibrionales bacterium RIFOXYC1_FULL_39_130]OFZ71127.1 MAG: hypothetical protein A2451_00370 [Bdellovibrionales bacterium RIFOXYC2_FULL_39_8]OFZ76694.1 MAG: hypothetical protein A2560_17555 [Bdellovibrionales bacterium RIFOXYD1_FULL_39_84]OFZ95929.1 MAG:
MRELLTTFILLMSVSSFAGTSAKWIRLEDPAKVSCFTNTTAKFVLQYDSITLFSRGRLSPDLRANLENQCDAILVQAKEEKSALYFNLTEVYSLRHIYEILVPENGFFTREETGLNRECDRPINENAGN